MLFGIKAEHRSAGSYLIRTTAPSARENAPWRRVLSAATAQETAALAARLARVLRRGDVVALLGDLGAGKTTFARGVIAALAEEAGLPLPEVPSPTFTLVQTYDFPRLSVWHFDLYRIDRPEDTIELGFDEALAEGALLIEWPERLGPMLPRERIEIALAFADGGGREITVTAPAAAAARLEAAFA